MFQKKHGISWDLVKQGMATSADDLQGSWFACLPMQAFDDSDMAETRTDRTYVVFLVFSLFG